MGISMTSRIAFVAYALFTCCMLIPTGTRAQDVSGIEICTVEKTMERRTSCLQSNIDFLQKTITKLAADHQQKIDAANRQIEGLKSSVASLQKVVDELTQKKTPADQKKAEDVKKSDAPVKDTPAAKEGAK
jgi:prefoldin subunit 5